MTNVRYLTKNIRPIVALFQATPAQTQKYAKLEYGTTKTVAKNH